MRNRIGQPSRRHRSLADLFATLLSLTAVLAPVCWRGAARADETRTTLYITVSNVRNSHGHIRLAVCTPRTFLGTDCPFHASAPAKIGSVTLRVADMAPGVYAVQAFHDEDDSGRIKRSLLGIPEEGVGFSNDVSVRFGAPRFSDAALHLTPGETQVSLRLQHFD
jgi:uncharacterized protein (DUF2141 family)